MAKTPAAPPPPTAARPTLMGRALPLVRNAKVAIGLGVLTTVAIIGIALGLTLLLGRASHVLAWPRTL